MYVNMSDATTTGGVTIAIQGCGHGELDNIYASIMETQKRNPESVPKIDLLVCCGDFQAVRNAGDLKCLNVPEKYVFEVNFFVRACILYISVHLDLTLSNMRFTYTYVTLHLFVFAR
jgi:hypothetical protein